MEGVTEWKMKRKHTPGRGPRDDLRLHDGHVSPFLRNADLRASVWDPGFLGDGEIIIKKKNTEDRNEKRRDEDPVKKPREMTRREETGMRSLVKKPSA